MIKYPYRQESKNIDIKVKNGGMDNGRIKNVYVKRNGCANGYRAS